MNIESDDNLDFVMRTSYNSLMLNINSTIEEFIVYTFNSEVIEIEHGTGERSKFINGMIKYFEEIEEYEKCNELLKLRLRIIKNGD